MMVRILLWLAAMTMAHATLADDNAQIDVKQSETYQQIKRALDAVPAIDAHEHLQSPQDMRGQVNTPDGKGMTLASLWQNSYFSWTTRSTPWPESGDFDQWWQTAQHDFDNAHAQSFYRYMLPAFRDLYGVDFDTITGQQARQLNQQIFQNYQKSDWVEQVVTERANIELIIVDPFWSRIGAQRDYKFSVPVLNVTSMIEASHPDRTKAVGDSPFAFAQKQNLPVDTFDEFLQVVEEIVRQAAEGDCVALKTTQAYLRTIEFAEVDRSRAETIYGKTPAKISAQEQKDFEDFMFWHFCRLAAQYELPFQIHTGQARIQGSNPLLLCDAIERNPETKFVLFHGGYPWVSETAVIGMKYRNVWIDSCWLPTLSYTMAKRAYQEILEAVPANRVLWGGDSLDAEGLYGATAFTRQCLAEALADKVQPGELRLEHAHKIGRQIMRENALELYPKLRQFLWRDGDGV